LVLKPKLDFIDSEIEQIKQNHLHRKLRYGTVNGARITIQGKNLVNLCSNDYLGIPVTNMRIKQMQSSSRLVSGNDESYLKLEKKIALDLSNRVHGKFGCNSCNCKKRGFDSK